MKSFFAIVIVSIFLITLPGFAADDVDGSDPIELTVTGTREVDDSWNVGPQISVTDKRDLEKAVVQTIPDLLQSTPGVHIQKTNHGGGSPFLRGLTGKQILLLVDGFRLNNSLYRYGPHQYLNTVDRFSLSKIDVMRGPGSLLYGSDALGGVLNLQTREPTKDGSVTPVAALGYSSADNGLLVHTGATGGSPAANWRSGLTWSRLDDLDAGGDIPRQEHTGYSGLSGDARFEKTLGRHHQLSAVAQFMRQYRVPKTAEMTLGGKLKYEYEPQLRMFAYLKLSGFPVFRLLFDHYEAGLSYQKHVEGERVRKKLENNETEEITSADTVGVIAHFSKSLAWRNRLSFGLSAYQDFIDSDKWELTGSGRDVLSPPFPDGAYYRTAGLYLQNRWQPVRWLTLLLGERFSMVRTEGELKADQGDVMQLELKTSAWTGSASLIVEPLRHWMIRAHVAQGFRAPNLEDFFGKVDFVTEVPNPDLESEKALSIEGGVGYRSEVLLVRGDLFHSQIKGLIGRTNVLQDVDGDGIADQVVIRSNLHKTIIQGGELQLKWHPIRALEFAGWWMRQFGDTHNADGTVEPARRTPPQQGRFAVSWRHEGGSFVVLELPWSDAQRRLSPGDIEDARIGPDGSDGYVIANLKGGYKISENSMFAVTFENLTDKLYKTHGSGVYAAGRGIRLEYRHGL